MRRKSDGRISKRTHWQNIIFSAKPAAPELTVVIKLFYFYRAVLKFRSRDVCARACEGEAAEDKRPRRQGKEARTETETTSEDERTVRTWLTSKKMYKC